LYETIGVLVGIGVMVVTFKPFFGDRDGFVGCLKFYLTPDVISLFRGRWGEDRWAEMKLGVWLVLGVLGGLAVVAGLKHLLGD